MLGAPRGFTEEPKFNPELGVEGALLPNENPGVDEGVPNNPPPVEPVVGVLLPNNPPPLDVVAPVLLPNEKLGVGVEALLENNELVLSPAEELVNSDLLVEPNGLVLPPELVAVLSVLLPNENEGVLGVLVLVPNENGDALVALEPELVRELPNRFPPAAGVEGVVPNPKSDPPVVGALLVPKVNEGAGDELPNRLVVGWVGLLLAPKENPVLVGCVGCAPKVPPNGEAGVDVAPNGDEVAGVEENPKPVPPPRVVPMPPAPGLERLSLPCFTKSTSSSRSSSNDLA